MRLHIWDTGGQEKFKAVSSLYYRGAHAALVCYSIIDDNSFRSLDDWVKQLDEHGNISKMVRFVIANKSDVDKAERRIEFKQGRAYAELKGYEFFETSAISKPESINEVFSTLAESIKAKYSE